MAVTTKMSVDVSGFKKGMAEAQASVKTMDAALKKNEAAYKATGNAEDYMAKKSDLLKQKLDSQNKVAKQAEQVLQAMGKNGVDPASLGYQKMAKTLLNAQTAALETQAAIDSLGQSTQQAATGADNLTKSVNGIGKKMSLDQVISGVDKITKGLETAAKKAVEFASALWGGVTESAQRGDDIATAAAVLGIDIESYQRYQKVFDQVGEITVNEWIKARTKVQSAILKTTDEQFDIFAALGVGIREGGDPRQNRYTSKKLREWEDVFWDLGKALREKVASKQITQDQADVYANALFGKTFSQLNPLFELGREGFYKSYNSQIVTSEEGIKKLADLNDELIKVQGDFKSLQDEVMQGLAPALQKGAEVLDDLLARLMEYLQKEEGQQMLERLGKAVEGLFDDISKIDPEEVVSGFVGVFESLISGLEWIINNKDTIVDGLKKILDGWAMLKLTGGALDMLKLIQGLQGLNVGEVSGTGGTETTGTSTTTNGKPILTGNGNVDINTDVVMFDSGVGGMGFVFSEGVKEITKSISSQQQFKDLMRQYGLDPENSDLYWETYNAVHGGPGSERQKQVIEEALNNGGAIHDYLPKDTEEVIKQLAFSKREIFSEGFQESMFQGLQEIFNEGSPTEIPAELSEVDIMQSLRNALAVIGTVTIPAQLDIGGISTGTSSGGTVGRGDVHVYDPGSYIYSGIGHANGLPFVPYDGYLSVLHRGERVLTASQNRNYTANSNLYVENMNMNNGMDAQALAAAMSAQNRRISAGFGS